MVKKRKEKRIKVHLKIADPDRHGELASRKILAGQVWKQAFFPWGGRGRCPGVRPPAGWVGDRWDRGEVAEDLLTAAGEADDDKKSYWESSTGRTSLSRAGGTLHIKYEGALLCLWNRECNLGNLLWAIAQALGVGPEDYEVVSGLSVKSDVPRRWIRHSLAVPLDWDPST